MAVGTINDCGWAVSDTGGCIIVVVVIVGQYDVGDVGVDVGWCRGGGICGVWLNEIETPHPGPVCFTCSSDD